MGQHRQLCWTGVYSIKLASSYAGQHQWKYVEQLGDAQRDHGKDKSEYVSPGLREYQFNITLSSRLGVNPRKVFDALMDLCEAGAVDYFIINNRPVSQNPFMLEKVADEWGAVHRFWGLTSGKLTLTLKEYT